MQGRILLFLNVKALVSHCLKQMSISISAETSESSGNGGILVQVKFSMGSDNKIKIKTFFFVPWYKQSELACKWSVQVIRLLTNYWNCLLTLLSCTLFLSLLFTESEGASSPLMWYWLLKMCIGILVWHDLVIFYVSLEVDKEHLEHNLNQVICRFTCSLGIATTCGPLLVVSIAIFPIMQCFWLPPSLEVKRVLYWFLDYTQQYLKISRLD